MRVQAIPNKFLNSLTPEGKASGVSFCRNKGGVHEQSPVFAAALRPGSPGCGASASQSRNINSL